MRRRIARVRSSNETRSQTLAQITSDRLRKDIITGMYESDERLTLTTLCARYEVSMSPLREALAGLAAEHFIVFEERLGFRVDALSEADLDDLTETRKLVEATVLSIALREGDEVWESEVIAAFHQLAHTERRIIITGKRDDPEWEVRNEAFHDAISNACPLRLLKQLRAQVFNKALRYRYIAWLALPNPTIIAAEHREIFEATIERDEARLIAASNAHIGHVATFARPFIQRARTHRESQAARKLQVQLEIQ
jgi:GntR family carbon starvation induced transcriptional regulator